MNKTAFIIVVIIVAIGLGACSDSTKETSSAMVNTMVKPKSEIDFITGVWVSKDYILCLEEGTPSSCYKNLLGIASILINQKSIGVSFNNHEGGIAEINTDEEGNIFLKINDQNHQVSIEEKTLILTLKDEKSNAEKRFVKILDDFAKDSDAGIGIDLITRKIVFAGTYLVCDTDSNCRDTVIFNSNGSINGWEYGDSFDLCTDFTEATEEDYKDHVNFYSNNEFQISYSFNRETDGFSLSKNAEGEESEVLKLVRLK
ncbi:MAG: hypothetical protein KDC83_14925 [Flavobacteriales bacterium]|nr:hypothetical protein [Flavobacteriales bacterium]